MIPLRLTLLLLSVLVASVVASIQSQYLYDGQKDATAVTEFKDGLDMASSKAPKIVVFYSPYCG